TARASWRALPLPTSPVGRRLSTGLRRQRKHAWQRRRRGRGPARWPKPQPTRSAGLWVVTAPWWPVAQPGGPDGQDQAEDDQVAQQQDRGRQTRVAGKVSA